MKSRKMIPQIKLSDAQKKKLNDEIKAFYLDERGEEIGIIEQMQLLELFEQKMAPIIYNKALDDAKQWFSQMMENVDSDFYSLYKVEKLNRVGKSHLPLPVCIKKNWPSGQFQRMLRILSWRLSTLWRNFLLYKKELAQRPIPKNASHSFLATYNTVA